MKPNGVYLLPLGVHIGRRVDSNLAGWQAVGCYLGTWYGYDLLSHFWVLRGNVPLHWWDVNLMHLQQITLPTYLCNMI